LLGPIDTRKNIFVLGTKQIVIEGICLSFCIFYFMDFKRQTVKNPVSPLLIITDK
jgi:hypothetical protein